MDKLMDGFEFKWIKSHNGRYLYAEHNPSIRADLNGNVYGGGVINYGSQDIQWDYFSPLNSDELDKHHQDIIPVGIYQGGRLERLSDILVRVYPLVIQISDGTKQARIETSANADIAIGAATPYVVIRWSWSAIVNWYADFLAVAVGSILSTDIVVGKAIYAGPVITGFDYTNQTVCLSMERFLKVEPLDIPAMYVYLNPGWISYGTSRIAVPGQVSPIIVAPVSDSRIDLVYIDASGLIQISTGTLGPTPSPNSHDGKVVVAQILIATASTTITSSMITDCRPWANLGATSGSGITALVSAFLHMGA